MSRRKIIISGGGTAGHIHPALAVAHKLKERDSEIDITFVGSTRRLEKTIMERHQVDFIPLKIEGIKGKGIRLIKSIFFLPAAFMKSYAILRKIRPSLSIGVGGYSSGPILLLSAWMSTPTLILEQNSLPGFTNRLLIPRIDRAVVSFESSLPYFRGKGVVIGNPVREEFYAIPPKSRADTMTLLIFGGSQGSLFLNNALIQTLPLLKNQADGLIIYHQTGEKDCDRVQQAYLKNGFRNVLVKSYFEDMAHYFEKADLVICRAGATTIAELIAARKASLLIPYAHAADDHQRINAEELEKIQGTEMITEQKFTPELFADKLVRFMMNKSRLDQMEKNLNALRKTGVADKIADLCFELIREKGRQ